MSLGRAVLDASDLDSYGLFVLICIGALLTYTVGYNLFIVLAMSLLSCELPTHAKWCTLCGVSMISGANCPKKQTSWDSLPSKH